MYKQPITYERWTKEDEKFLLQYAKPIKLQEALDAYRGLRAQQGKEERSLQSVRLKLYKLSNEGQGIIPGFDTDIVHRGVLESYDHAGSELQQIGQKHQLDQAQEKIRAAKRTLWKSRQELLESRMKEDLVHASELERIHGLEERLLTEFGMTLENP
ncbi:MAG: hypothetical protein J3Q66DRAFT_390318 [Benniella sp.]|nr:MAG: hypothetical protein J3Q66DRAFT_390318 [Benniella sp.]